MRQNPQLRAFFENGFFEEYWASQLEESVSEREAQQVLRLLNAKTGHILDWRGGWGRHAIHFARAGLQVTVLDFIARYLEQAQRRFGREGLQLNTIKVDCRRTPANVNADFATCLMNSVGFLEPTEELKAFRSLHAALKSRGKLLIDCMNLFFVTSEFTPIFEAKSEDGTVYRAQGRLDLRSQVLYETFEIQHPDGKIARANFDQTMYTPHDLEALLTAAGFRVEGVFGSYEGEPLTLESKKIVLLASK